MAFHANKNLFFAKFAQGLASIWYSDEITATTDSVDISFVEVMKFEITGRGVYSRVDYLQTPANSLGIQTFVSIRDWKQF